MPDNAASGLWRIAGVDMSAQPEKTALAYFEFGPGDRIVLHQEPGPPRRKAEGKTKRVDNARLVDLFREPHTVVGIDAPLGWPTDFVTAVTAWSSTPRTNWDGLTDGFRNLKFRDTDNEAQRHDDKTRPKTWPNGYSVAADKIAVTTFRALACVTEAYDDPSEVDITGETGRLIEVWPGASLAALDIDSKGYKKNTPSGLAIRRRIAGGIMDLVEKADRRFDMVAFGSEGLEAMARTDHALDAVIAAITAWAAVVGRTVAPPAGGDRRKRCQTEGWIHVPCTADLLGVLSIDPVPFLASRIG